MREKSKTYVLFVSVISLTLLIMPFRGKNSMAYPPTSRPQVGTGESPHPIREVMVEKSAGTALASTYDYHVGGAPDPADWPIQDDVSVSGDGLRLAGFDYPDFTSLSGLSLNGVAAQHGNRLRLTPSVMYETGAVWHTAKQPVRDGFETTFQFQVSDLVNDGADGFAFVIQNHNGLAIGSGGGSLGYAHIPNSLAVEFDTSTNEVIDDPNDNHISVQTRGTEVNDANHAYSIASATSIPDLSDGAVHTVTVSYEPGEMRVFLDGATSVLIASVDLSETLALDDGYAWVGFTATTGGLWENHDILSWCFETGIDEAVASASGAVAPVGDSHRPGNERDFGLLVDESWPAPPEVDMQRPQYGSSVGRTRYWSSSSDSSFVTPPQPRSSDSDSGGSAAAPLWQGTFALNRIASPDVTFVVTSTTDAGSGSLREAMSNASAGDTITFDAAIFPPDSPVTITLNSPLPEVTQGNLTIDASNAGVALDGRELTQGNGLRIVSSGNVIKGLKIVHFPNNGIEVADGAQYNQIGGEWTEGEGPRGEGNIITLNGSDGVEVGGVGTMSNTVSGNLIGLDMDGTRDFRVQEIAISPVYTQDHTVFVGTRYDGVWKTTDGGETWAAVNNGLTISNVLALDISPAYGSDQTLFVGSEEGDIFRTTDGGASWMRVDGGMAGERRVQALDISPDYANDGTVFVVDDDDGLFVSTDGGETWENRSAGLSGHEWELSGLRLSPNYAVDQTILAFSWEKVFKSTDRGHSWITVTSNITNLGVLAFSPNYAVDQTIFLGLDHCEAETRPMFWKSIDAGAHWTPISGTLGTCGVRALQFAPKYQTNQTLFAGDAWSGVYKSTDGGASWLKVKSGRFNWAMAISPAYAQDKTVFIGQRTGEIIKTVDRGDTWTQLGTNLTEQGNYDEGVRIWNGAQWNIVGGKSTGERNVISNNGIRGVVIQNGDTSHNRVVGNFIGTTADGTKPLGNDAEGIVVELGTHLNYIQDNVIAGNAMSGIHIRYADTMSNAVTGNYIGVDVSGMRPLGNDSEGVIMMRGVRGNQVGGDESAERNVISANGGSGVGIWHPGAERNIVSGNYIGVSANGMDPLGN